LSLLSIFGGFYMGSEEKMNIEHEDLCTKKLYYMRVEVLTSMITKIGGTCCHQLQGRRP
jgi:hypothetical protein